MDSGNYRLEIDVPLKLLGMFGVHVSFLGVLIYFSSGFLVRLDGSSHLLAQKKRSQVPWCMATTTRATARPCWGCHGSEGAPMRIEILETSHA